jgi:hypothetical protein
MTDKKKKEFPKNNPTGTVKQDCVITHLATVYMFKKGDSVDNDEIAELLDRQGLLDKGV